MDWVDEVIESLGGVSAVAAALKLPETTVSSWKSRRMISPGYWPSLAALPPKPGARKVSFIRLAQLACAADAERLTRDRRKKAA
jgi:hypothetical protein